MNVPLDRNPLASEPALEGPLSMGSPPLPMAPTEEALATDKGHLFEGVVVRSGYSAPKRPPQRKARRSDPKWLEEQGRGM